MIAGAHAVRAERPAEMFQRFSDQARRVVVLAQEEARMLNHDSIGTEHILLGLIREDEGTAAQVLQSLGLDLEAVRQQVAEIVGQDKQGQDKQGQDTQGESGHIPFTSRAKKVLELSLREALQRGANHIGTEHLLLGLIRVGDDSVAAQVLLGMGANLSRVRAQVIQRMASPLADVIATGEVESRLIELTEQVRQLSEEVERLRGLLREHGLERDEGTT
jgi:ATP-dependent Clp protease ATP-binding subunit ClpC